MRYIHGDISHFLHKVIKTGEMMTDIMCCKRKCLNNKKGKCTANVIEYDGLCQTYITQGNASKSACGLCVRSNGKLKRKGGEVLR